jgi:hypothetical protein
VILIGELVDFHSSTAARLSIDRYPFESRIIKRIDSRHSGRLQRALIVRLFLLIEMISVHSYEANRKKVP